MGGGNRDRQGVCTAQGERFRDQFAEHDMEVGDDAESKSHGHDGGDVRVHRNVCGRVGEQAHPVQEDAGHQGFADPAQGQRTKGDAELHGGKKIVELPLQQAHGARAGYTVGQHLLDACFADGNQRELRGHEKTVGQDQHGDRNALQQQ